jgi:site-specific DNA recombinase
MGKLYDDRGNRMSPSFSSKNSVRYRFYVSAALLRGRKAEAGSIGRVAAPDIEAAVMTAVRQHDQNEACSSSDDANTKLDHVSRVEVGGAGLRIKLKSIPTVADDSDNQLSDEAYQTETIIEWPWQSPGKTTTTANHILPQDETSRPNPNWLQAVVRAHAWIRQLTDGTYATIEQLASASQLHPKIVRQSIKMAFLSPDATASILRGDDYSDFGSWC